MAQRPKFKIIKKPKILKLKTPEEIFKYLFQKQINFDFLEKHGIEKTTQINLDSEIGKTIFQEGKDKLKKIINTYDILDINTKTIQRTPKQQVSIINVDNLGNNNNLYFKYYSPNLNSLFYNILSCIYPKLTLSNDLDFLKLELTKLLSSLDEKDDSFENFIINPIKGDFEINFQLIQRYSKIISKYLNKAIVIIQDSIPSINVNEINSCTDETINIDNTDILLLYMSYNQEFYFEPIINLNLQIPNKINFLIYKNTPNIKQHSYIKSLINSPSKDQVVSIPKSAKQTFKLPLGSQTEYVVFNPYDKNVELPIIEINIDSSKKVKFLLGHEIDNFYNIYDEISYDIAGKLKFNQNDTLDVNWCEGFPK